jgi:hypothetical protein
MNSRLGYLQARTQAHYAQLPDDRLWLHLGALKEIASFLEEARSTTLSQWITGLSASSSVVEIEQYLQRRLIESIREAAAWAEKKWHPAINWLETLIELPTLESLRRDGMAPDAEVSQMLLTNLAESEKRDADLHQAWINAWQMQWPHDTAQHLDSMRALLRILSSHWRQFPELPVEDAWNARQQLEDRLRLFFRRHVLQPVIVFAYLSLVMLCLERLRAELLQRVLFPEKVVAS